MKILPVLLFGLLAVLQLTTCAAQVSSASQPFELVVTPYKTTMIADGRDTCLLKIIAVDRTGVQVPNANILVHYTLSGDAKILSITNVNGFGCSEVKDATAQCRLTNGESYLTIRSGSTKSTVHFEAKADSLHIGSTDIAIVTPGAPHLVSESNNPFPTSKRVVKTVDKMLGADISFLPELESRGMRFFDRGMQKDPIQILKDHGFNYIRLRIFVNPANDSGYSPGKGFCGLEHTKQMARRVKDAGMKFLLDFHYSDYWADPGKQIKPASWRNEDFIQLKKSVYDYTKMVMQQLKDQETEPDMVQVGNEINHGMIWPEGSISNLDSLAQLIYAGINGVLAVAPSTTIMLHIALGGQNAEAHFFLDNMIARGIPFDVIGLSYYPKWHGTLNDLRDNINELSRYYKKDLIIVEYSQYKREVNDIAFNVEGGRGKGSCIWEPLNTWESIFDKNGNANDYLYMCDAISAQYIKNK